MPLRPGNAAQTTKETEDSKFHISEREEILEKQRNGAFQELRAIEEVLEQAMVFEMDPTESFAEHIEHIIEYVHDLEEKLQDAAITRMMIQALVRDSEEL